MKDRTENAIRILIDTSAPCEDRIFAAKSLGDAGAGTAVEALVNVGSRPDEPRDLLTAIGTSLATLKRKGTDSVETDGLSPSAAAALRRHSASDG